MKKEQILNYGTWSKAQQKKIKSNDCVSHFPKKPFLKKEVSKPFQNTSKTEKKISLDKTSNINNKR